MASHDLDTFAGVKTRLSEIVDEVSNDALSLDDALALYEEAVTLGLRASDLLEADIDADADAEDESASENPDNNAHAAGASAEVPGDSCAPASNEAAAVAGQGIA